MEFLFDENLTLKEKGLLAMIYLGQATEKIDKNFILENSKDGISAIDSVLKSVKHKNYLHTYSYRRDNGTFKPTVWKVYLKEE
jgi:hypothetical protein